MYVRSKALSALVPFPTTASVKGFTTMSQQLHPARVMLFLDVIYNAFDLLLDECGCYKVGTREARSPLSRSFTEIDNCY